VNLTTGKRQLQKPASQRQVRYSVEDVPIALICLIQIGDGGWCTVGSLLPGMMLCYGAFAA
jgi:hypothetical protein